jgi:mannose-6-phosphate isomerase-like protein (cupin superfamily)
MGDDAAAIDAIVPITGRRLALPAGPIFNLQRAGDADYELGAFRAWAGYKDLGCDAATHGLVLFQQVISFGATEDSGRTGIHCHLAHVHIVIPTSGRGVFSYDGVTTEAVPGEVIVQHGGTVHDQFSYSYVDASPEETKRTPVSLEPASPDAPPQSFGFLELFVPRTIANVEIVPPAEVTADDQATAWDHPYHARGASYAMQAADAATAGFHPVAGGPGLEARDCRTWAPSAELVATWIVRPATGSAQGHDVSLSISGETGGLSVLFMASGSANFRRSDGDAVALRAGDCLTCSAGLVGDPVDPSPDMRLLVFYVSAKAEALQERTPAEIERLEAMGPAIVTRRLMRPAHDDRPVNFLTDEDIAPV